MGPATPESRSTARSVAGRFGMNPRSKRNRRFARFRPAGGRSNTHARPDVVRDAGEFFSLLDERLKLGGEGYSPSLLAKIEYAGGNEGSFAQASRALGALAELSISAKHIQRIAERLGAERAAQRDAEVAAFRAGRLRPAQAQPPSVVAIHLDAGKIQLRTTDGEPGVREPHWGDTKVGCFLTYAPRDGDGDPQPQPPAAFLDPPRVMRLCREMERVRSPWPSPQPSPDPKAAPQAEESPAPERAQRLVRTAVATLQPVEPFGWMVAAEAMRRGFYAAKQRAVVGDGGNWIGPLGEMHFPGWVQVLDFLHLLVHLYAAATAAHRGQARRAWRFYEQCIRWAWSGDVAALIAGLQKESQRWEGPPPDGPDEDPGRIVSRTLEYVKNNAARMDYARYRRAGLPISSAPVESLIKQFNQRVKGSEKFWITPGAEAILQVRAAYLSEDDRAHRLHQRRPRRAAVGRNRRRLAA